MIFNLVFYIILSVSFIFFIHQLYEYFKNLYTVKRTKDVYKLYDEKYNKIIQDQTTDSFNKKQRVIDTLEVNADIVPKQRHSNPFLDKSANRPSDDAVVAVDELCEFAKLL